MQGISWSGFNALQVAARRPPALRAVISACSTDDRYADDVHFQGGCLLKDNLYWATYMFMLNGRPPDPAVVGDRWRAMWQQRLEGSPPFVETWLGHQRRDGYWRHGSICEDYAAIEIPVLLVGGWADSYPRPIFRMLEHLRCERRAIIGPWDHAWPQEARTPGPQIGFLAEAVKWWDRWLKDGVAVEAPLLRAWIQEPLDGPYTFREGVPERSGRWISESSWPSPNVAPKAFYPTQARGLASGPDERAGRGALSGRRLGGRRDRPPVVARPAGGRWAVADFTSAPLTERFEILGSPVVELDLSVDRARAIVSAPTVRRRTGWPIGSRRPAGR